MGCPPSARGARLGPPAHRRDRWPRSPMYLPLRNRKPERGHPETAPRRHSGAPAQRRLAHSSIAQHHSTPVLLSLPLEIDLSQHGSWCGSVPLRICRSVKLFASVVCRSYRSSVSLAMMIVFLYFPIHPQVSAGGEVDCQQACIIFLLYHLGGNCSMKLATQVGVAQGAIYCTRNPCGVPSPKGTQVSFDQCVV